MDNYYYAQLGENNICIAVSQLSGEVNQGDTIKLDNYDAMLLGKRYNNGTWEDVQQEPEQQHYTDTQLIMQALADQELRDLRAQAERQMLAQQITDVELATMGVSTNV